MKMQNNFSDNYFQMWNISLAWDSSIMNGPLPKLIFTLDCFLPSPWISHEMNHFIAKMYLFSHLIWFWMWYIQKKNTKVKCHPNMMMVPLIWDIVTFFFVCSMMYYLNVVPDPFNSIIMKVDIIPDILWDIYDAKL